MYCTIEYRLTNKTAKSCLYSHVCMVMVVYNKKGKTAESFAWSKCFIMINEECCAQLRQNGKNDETTVRILRGNENRYLS